MLLDVEHRFSFDYDGFVSEAQLELRVEPRSTPHQTVRSFYLAVGPPTTVARYEDWNGNRVHHFSVTGYHDRVEVLARSLVDVHPSHPQLAALGERAAREEPGPLLDFARFVGPVQDSAALAELDASLNLPDDVPLGALLDGIGQTFKAEFRYLADVTDYRSTTDHFLAQRAGVCQDFAHLALALLRRRRVPCRYVSGYLHVERQDDVPSQSHAWVETWSDEHGWVPYDPTHQTVPDADYVTVASGRSYDDVPPNRGIYRGSAHEILNAEVHTQRSERKSVVGLHEEIGEIDLPVYQELSAAPGGGADEQPDEPQQQQQQQQQAGPGSAAR